jgi:nitroreductase family protein
MNRRQMMIGAGGLAALGGGAVWAGMRQIGSSSDYDRAVQAMRRPLSARPDAPELIRYAALAANGHNTQPWTFGVAPGRITLRPDFSRRTPVVDPDDHHLFVSLGCAAENLAIAAAARGHRGALAFDGGGQGQIAFAHEPGAPLHTALFDAIARRQSTRAEFDGRAVSAADLKILASAAAVPGVDMLLVSDRRQRDRVRDLVVAGNSAQMADPGFVRELKAWLRFNPRHALRAGDGLYSAASGNPILPDWLGERAFDRFVTAASENDKYARQLASSSGVAVFVGERNDREHWMRAGQACQRFALQATALGLKHAFVNQPVEVPALRGALAQLVGAPGRRPDIVMRFGYGPTLPYSARRPVQAILSPG